MRFGYILIICVLFCINLSAKNITFQQLNVEQGLLSSNIFAVNQDLEGRLLLGTEDGLNIYDGTTFEIYNRKNGLLGKMIFDVKIIDSILYVFSNKELAIIQNGKVSSVRLNATIGYNPNNKIFTNKHNDIYVFAENNILYLNAEHKLEHVAANIRLVLYHNDEIILIDHERVYYRIQKKGLIKLDEADPAYQALSTFISKKPKAIFTLSSRINTRNIDTLYDRLQHTPESMFAERAVIDQKGRTWIAMYPYGLALLSPDNQLTIYDESNGFKNDFISDIYQDHSGTIWIAVFNQGLFKIVESDISVVKTQAELGDIGITSLTTYNNELFATTNTRKIYNITNGSLVSLAIPVDAYQDIEFKLKVLNGQLYFIRGSRIYQYVNQKWQLFYEKDIFKDRQVYTDLLEIDGELYVVKMPKSELINIKTGKALLIDEFKFYAQVQTVNGIVYFSCPEGLYKLEKKGGKFYKSYIYKDEEITHFTTDGKDVIYFNTVQHGLVEYHISSNVLVKFPRNVLNTEKLIIKDLSYVQDALWIGTTNGYYKIYKEDGVYRRKNYDNDRFLYGMSTLMGCNNSLKNGELYFASNKGIFSVNVMDTGTMVVNYPVVFSKYQVLGEKGDLKEHLIFNNRLDTVLFPNVSQLIIYFSQLDFSYNNHKEYKIQIEGIHDVPVITSYNRAVISTLKPGEYQIKVWGKNSHGEWLDEPSVITYVVNEYFYNTLIFKIAIALLVIGLYLFYKIWSAKQHAKKEAWKQQLREEEQAIIRQRTAEDFHDEIGNKLTRLGLLATVAEQKAKNQDFKGAESAIDMLKENVNQLYKGSKDIIWSLQPQSEYLFEIVNKVIENSKASLDGTPIVFEDNLLFIDEKAENVYHTEKVGTDVGRNLTLIFKECINNVIKHSGADYVFFEVIITTDEYIFVLKDNGKGYNTSTLHEGNGLRNMEQRATRIKGAVKISSTQDGTEIRLIVGRKKTKNK